MKYYVVKVGNKPGIYTDWASCKSQVDGYPGAVYKSFKTKEEAEAWLGAGVSIRIQSQAPQRSSGRVKMEPGLLLQEIAAAPAPESEFQAEYVIYTDGSCLVNPGGPGGWAAVLFHQASGQMKEISGGHPETTNNRMELTAALKGLSCLPRPARVLLYTDSQYLKNAFTKHWLASWKKRSWRKADGNPVLNQDLWQLLDQQVSRHQIRFAWVKGHNGNTYNERCDELARQEAHKFS